MSLIFIASTSFVVALSGALVPGPLFTITVAETARRGFIAGPLIILGHGILELALVVMLVAGLAPLLSNGTAIMVIGILGGLMLMLMGAGMIREAGRAEFSMRGEAGHRRMNPVLAGIVGSISNPYWTVWWATIGLGYLVSAVRSGMTGVAVFFIGHILGDLGWYSLVSLAVDRGRKVMSDRAYRYLFYGCGVFLLIFGVWFIADMPS